MKSPIDTKAVKLNKRERQALHDLREGIVVSTAQVFSDLVSRGLAESTGLRLASRSRSGATFKSSYRITDAGLAALKNCQQHSIKHEWGSKED